MTSSLFRCFFIIFLLYILIGTSFTLPVTGVKLQLIHRCSLPEYSNETWEYIVETNLKLLTRKFAAIGEEKFSVETPLIQFSTTRSIYFVNVSIGNPPVPQYLQVDTGSSLTWVSGKSDPPRQYFYNPAASDTFKYMNCGDSICSPYNQLICLSRKTNHCGYQMMYVDGTKSSGIIGYDRFGFVNGRNREDPSIVENVLFGALGNVKGGTETSKDSNYYGILGIGPERTSLVNQLPDPRMFRYCVANLSSADNSQGYLNFGEVEWDYDDIPTTPLVQGYEHYMVEIQSICMDNVCLNIDPAVFKNVPGDGDTGVLIDTGAILSFLPDLAYDAVEWAVLTMMESKNQTRYRPKVSPLLCYEGNLNDAVHDYYPLLTINFVGGAAQMVISRTEYFFQSVSDVYCLSFLRTSRFGANLKNYTIIGLQTQQYHVFEYNLDNGTLGIMGDTSCDDI